MDIYQIIKEPRITEKANLQKEGSNQISFKVDRRANKIEIRKAIEILFMFGGSVVGWEGIQARNLIGRKQLLGWPRIKALSFLRVRKFTYS